MPLAHIYNALVEWLAHAPGIYGAQMSASRRHGPRPPFDFDLTQASTVPHRALAHQAFGQSDGKLR
jgi:hypothetical protein